MNPNQRIHQELDENGYVIINLLNEDEVQSLLSFDKNSSLPDDLINFPMSFSINTSEVSYRQLVTQEIKRLFAPKLANLFPKYRIALSNFVRKKPNLSSSIMPLHQDPSLVDESSLNSFGVWCPLIDVDEPNGCIQVVKKSHLLNSKLRPFWMFEDFPYSQDILSIIQQQYLTSIPMKAGQALIYDKRLFHGSPPNKTATERVAAICSLVPQEILTHFCYRESPTSDKIELFEVEDEFYDRYIVGEKPEGVKSLGIFDYEVEPLTPEKLMETLEKESEFSSTNNQILSPQSQGWMLTAQQLQDELTQTQAELKESNEQLHQTQDELEELKIQQSQTQAELEQSQTQLQTQLTELAELRKSNEQLHQTQDELEELKIQQSQTQAELEQDREQLHQTQDELEELKIQQSQRQAELEHSCTQLQAQLTESNERLHQRMRELQALQEEYSHTKLELEEYRDKLHLSEAELEQDRQQLHQAQNKLEELKIQQSQTQSELEQSQTQLHQTQAQSEHYQIQLHQIQEQLEHSQIQLQQKTVELNKLKSQQHHTRLAEIIKERSQI